MRQQPLLGSIPHATMEVLLEVVFSMWSTPSLYNETDQVQSVQKYKRLKLGGGQAYDHSSD
jgi:hypothetical protein